MQHRPDLLQGEFCSTGSWVPGVPLFLLAAWRHGAIFSWNNLLTPQATSEQTKNICPNWRSMGWGWKQEGKYDFTIGFMALVVALIIYDYLFTHLGCTLLPTEICKEALVWRIGDDGDDGDDNDQQRLSASHWLHLEFRWIESLAICKCVSVYVSLGPKWRWYTCIHWTV